MYKSTDSTAITRLSDNASIPADPNNRDYAEYLEWVAAGNVATPQYTVEEQAAIDKVTFNADVNVKLAALDLKCIRPLVSNDTVFLETLKKQITDLRATRKK